MGTSVLGCFKQLAGKGIGDLARGWLNASRRASSSSSGQLMMMDASKDAGAPEDALGMAVGEASEPGICP